MKLIYAKGTCAFSVHLLLEELGVRYDTEVVSLEDKSDLLQYNLNGYVPVLQLDDGHIMTEAIAILQFLAETRANGRFIPAIGTRERAECLQWLTFASTELHQKLAPFFHKEEAGEEFIQFSEEKLTQRLRHLDERLSRGTYLLGDRYTIADMYTFAIIRLFGHVDFDLSPYKSIQRFMAIMEAMPVVVKLTEAEEREAALLTEKNSGTHPDLPPMNLDEYTLSHH